MNQRMKTYTFQRPTLSTNDYNDEIKTLETLQPIKAFISANTQAEYQSNNFEIDNWQYTAVTKDSRPVKGDVIDGKEVLFVINNRRYNTLLMQDIS